MRTRNENVDDAEDVEGKEQIIWCFISRSRTGIKKTSTGDLCATGRHTPSASKALCLSKVSHDSSQAPMGTKIFQITLINSLFRRLPTIFKLLRRGCGVSS